MWKIIDAKYKDKYLNKTTITKCHHLINIQYHNTINLLTNMRILLINYWLHGKLKQLIQN